MAIKKWIPVLVCVFITHNLCGQIYLKTKSFQRIAYQNRASFAWSGAALDLGYRAYFSRSMGRDQRQSRFNAGVELGFIEWGSQVLPYIGFARGIHVAPKVFFSAGGCFYNGLLLFRPKPFYEFAAEAQGALLGKVSPRLDLGFGTAVRYSISPKYRQYSSIYSYWHFTAEVMFIFRKPKNAVKRNALTP